MQIKASHIQEYLDQLPDDRLAVVERLRSIFLEKLPDGFEETMSYGMITYVVPHSIYPAGYHCDPKQALPFLSVASQKNFVAVYHMGIYADPTLLEWFTTAYPQHAKGKLDMGKSCIRFKKMDDIPYELLGELAEKMSATAWVTMYENAYKPKK
jgi:uncharacterized protein YdhG (YjbR/CyaY superfamily)